jgi:hypothetical protein
MMTCFIKSERATVSIQDKIEIFSSEVVLLVLMHAKHIHNSTLQTQWFIEWQKVIKGLMERIVSNHSTKDIYIWGFWFGSDINKNKHKINYKREQWRMKLVEENYPPLNIYATMNDSNYDSRNMNEDAHGKPRVLRIKPYYFLLLGMLSEECYQRSLVPNMQPWRVLLVIQQARNH